MFVIIGIVVVFGAIIAGYLLEHGNLLVLMQPAELIIIGGAAAGTLLIANPLPTVIKILKGVMSCLKPSPFTKSFYLDHLKMMFELFTRARRQGLSALEADLEKPAESQVFANYPKFLANHHALEFVCDTLRTHVAGASSPFELDQLMELDLEVHHHEGQAPISALSTVADSLPGLGIVAAVLGVVITMGALAGPPEEIGHKVAAALVGTFLGILLCYGLIGPVAGYMAKLKDEEDSFFRFLRVGVYSFIRGDSPIIAVEYARRSIQTSVRPNFQDTEAHCRGTAAEAPPAENQAA
ncbi:MAG: flagellar motor stator protein MotA [Bryobacteraceae bacterium]